MELVNNKNKILRSLNQDNIFSGVKPVLHRPTGRDRIFDKSQPMGEFNFPLTKITEWKIYGYKWDATKTIKRPYWLTKRLPTGQPLICNELDGIYKTEKRLIGMISPQQEQKKEYHDTPYLFNKKVKWRSQNI